MGTTAEQLRTTVGIENVIVPGTGAHSDLHVAQYNPNQTRLIEVRPSDMLVSATNRSAAINADTIWTGYENDMTESVEHSLPRPRIDHAAAALMLREDLPFSQD